MTAGCSGVDVSSTKATPTAPSAVRAHRVATWRLVWRLFGLQPWRYAMIAGLWVLAWGAPLAAGQLLRAFFNALEGQPPPVVPLVAPVALAPVSLTPVALLVLLVTAALGREVARFAVFFT